jgi:hypothetical protein
MTTIATHSALLTELAGLFGKAYVRLIQTRRNMGTSRAREPQEELDLRTKESPPVVQEMGGHRGDNVAP